MLTRAEDRSEYGREARLALILTFMVCFIGGMGIIALYYAILVDYSLEYVAGLVILLSIVLPYPVYRYLPSIIEKRFHNLMGRSAASLPSLHDDDFRSKRIDDLCVKLAFGSRLMTIVCLLIGLTIAWLISTVIFFEGRQSLIYMASVLIIVLLLSVPLAAITIYYSLGTVQKRFNSLAAQVRDANAKTLNGTALENDDSVSSKPVVEEEGGHTPYEKEMQDFLCKHPEAIEPGMKCIERDHRTKGNLRIDLLCVDSANNYVAVEITRGQADEKVCLQQAIPHMAALRVSYGEHVRAIVIAESFSPGFIDMAKANNIRYLKFEELPPINGNVQNCQYCGSPNPETAIYCMKCGKQIAWFRGSPGNDGNEKKSYPSIDELH
jgi:ribosomal protein L40E/membrane protein YdbS with pleckstrin-like domain